jgi:hypothetical protein
MVAAQNGWPVVWDTDAGRLKLVDLVLPGGPMDHHVYVLAGDVATIARWHVREYHRRVEPIKSAGCWGWSVRRIGDGPDWSNHAAACAWDLNAPDNPDGAPPARVMTPAQIAQCHALERESAGVLRWGGDWSDPDPMHWEIVGTPTMAANLAAYIRAEENALTTPAQNWAHDIDSSAGTYSAGGALWTVLGRTGALTGATGLPTVLGEVKANLDALVADVDVDLDALGASLVYLKSGLDLLLADPFDIGEAHPLVQVHRYIQAHPTPPA